MKLIVVCGSFEGNPEWLENSESPFRKMIAAEGFDLATDSNGIPFRWHNRLGGVPFMNRIVWERDSKRLIQFMSRFSDDDLNLIGRSHGGQLTIIATAALASVRKVRTITTLATPVRTDVPVKQAAQNTYFWQHVFDADKDLTAVLKRNVQRRDLGGLDDGTIVPTDRFYRQDGVYNLPLKDIGHSELVWPQKVNGSKWIGYWKTILANIRNAG